MILSLDKNFQKLNFRIIGIILNPIFYLFISFINKKIEKSNILLLVIIKITNHTTMNSLPADILTSIFEFFNQKDQLKLRQVSSEWKNLIEKKVFGKTDMPSIDECILKPDYYHFQDYYSTNKGFSKHHIALMILTQDPMFLKYCKNYHLGNSDRRNLLEKYASENDIFVMNYLVNKYHCSDSDGTVLKHAIKINSLHMIKLLLDSNATNIHIDDDLPLRWAIENNLIDMVKQLLLMELMSIVIKIDLLD